MGFEIGHKVTVIDEQLEGVIKSIDKEWVTFECTDGFDYTYPKSSLFVKDENDEVEFHPRSIQIEMKEADLPAKRLALKPIQLIGAKPEVDLHMEEIMPHRAPTRAEVSLEIQLGYAEAVIAKARSARLRQLVFIHGMGQGVLREELRKLLDAKYPNIEYFDGNYQKFGQGATEIIIHGLGSI